jgi:hypothetical protein
MDANITETPMPQEIKIVSKFLVLDDDQSCRDQIRKFCDENNLIPLKVQADNVMGVLKSNVDLGGILLAENFGSDSSSGLQLAHAIHAARPELPIFLRRESCEYLDDLAPQDQRLFASAFMVGNIVHLRAALDESIFSFAYPNVLVRGISELTTAALESQFINMKSEVEAPYIVRDKLIFGEIFTLIPVENNWCRGYMMLQSEEQSLLELVKFDRTHVSADKADNFRGLNGVLGEITNLVWGAFKNRYSGVASTDRHLSQVPIVINHLHRYISFGSDNPQLCFRYTLTDLAHADASPLVINQKFVFNLNWNPDDFSENETSVEDLVSAGELDLF